MEILYRNFPFAVLLHSTGCNTNEKGSEYHTGRPSRRRRTERLPVGSCFFRHGEHNRSKAEESTAEESKAEGGDAATSDITLT